jgi:hypothetical protein
MTLIKILVANGFAPVLELLTIDEMFAYYVSIVNDNASPNDKNTITYPYSK